MDSHRARVALVWLMALTVVIAVTVTIAYVIRNRDLKDQANARTQERTAQLAFLCKKVNALGSAAESIINPPGAVQYPQRVRAEKLLAHARCSPDQFKLTK